MKSAPVCSTCNDTHMMPWSDEDMPEVMCTRCPTPCQKCRAGGTGAYCSTTPCSCTCHVKKEGAAPLDAATYIRGLEAACATLRAKLSEVERERDEQSAAYAEAVRLLQLVSSTRADLVFKLDQSRGAYAGTYAEFAGRIATLVDTAIRSYLQSLKAKGPT